MISNKLAAYVQDIGEKIGSMDVKIKIKSLGLDPCGIVSYLYYRQVGDIPIF